MQVTLFVSTVFIVLTSLGNVFSQSFKNPGLETSDTRLDWSYSVLPDFWSSVPYDDPICEAKEPLGATPDLTNGHYAPWGTIAGTSHSGITHLTGLHSCSDSRVLTWHEGIMQTVSGFIPGKYYSINLQQAVVKDRNAIDTSGSWIVYIDSLLIDITFPSHNNESYASKINTWEHRTLSFLATNTTHTLKFLPHDEDGHCEDSSHPLYSGIRMGIDSIYLNPCDFELNIEDTYKLCPNTNDSLILDSKVLNANYLWQDGSQLSTYTHWCSSYWL